MAGQVGQEWGGGRGTHGVRGPAGGLAPSAIGVDRQRRRAERSVFLGEAMRRVARHHGMDRASERGTIGVVPNPSDLGTPCGRVA